MNSNMNMDFIVNLPAPKSIKEEYPLDKALSVVVEKRNREIIDAFCGNSDKFVLIIGPCSADNEDSVMDYITRLRRLGFPCEAENVFTSGMATGMYLNQNYAGKPVYLVGTEAFRRELLSYGIPLVEEGAEIVVVGFDTELVYEKLNKACHFLRRGAVFIAANPDWVCPMPNDEVLPDCGSICALLTASSGKEPFFIGKPNRSMIDVIANERGIPNEKICAVGDRLYTDIAVAQNAGSVSVLVLSGETSPQMAAEALRKPDYILPSVKELHEALRGEYQTGDEAKG